MNQSKIAKKNRKNRKNTFSVSAISIARLRMYGKGRQCVGRSMDCLKVSETVLKKTCEVP
jgi:hypothetical protein